MLITLRSASLGLTSTAAVSAVLLLTTGVASGAPTSAQLGPAVQTSKASGTTSYSVALPTVGTGAHRLRLSLSEDFYGSAGTPLFPVSAEGVDVSALGSRVTANVVDFPAVVLDGALDSVLRQVPNRVKVTKIEAVADVTPPATTAPATTAPVATAPVAESTPAPADPLPVAEPAPSPPPAGATFAPGTAVPPIGASFPAPTCRRSYVVPGLVSSTTIGDNTAAFNTALAAAVEGDCLTVPAGFYRRSGNIDVPGTKRNISVLGAGRGKTVLYGTSLDKHGFRILGADGIRLQGMTIDTVTGGTRTGQNQQGNATLLLDPGTEGFLGQDLLLRNARAAGFFAYGARDYHLHRVEVEGSLADGFHNTNGSQRGTFTDSTSTRTGDDGWAMVAYGGADATVPRDFTVTRFTVNGTTWGRGFGIVNSSGLTVNGPTVIRDTAAAGILVARETQYGGQMHPVRNIRFLGETRVERANHAAPDHGAVLIDNPETSQPVEGVYLESVLAVDSGKNRSSFPSHNVYAKGRGRITAELRDFAFAGVGPRSLLGGARTADSSLTLTGWSPADGYRTP